MKHPPRAKPRRARWTLSQLVDYELLLQRYAETGAPEEALREEVLGRAEAGGLSPHRAEIQANRRWWLREYTEAWRRYLQTREQGPFV